MEQNSIVVKNVTKKFDDFMLDHISFTVPTGRIVGFIGENGAGKTTLLNIICGYIKPSVGLVQYKGENIFEKPLTIQEFGILIEPQFLDYISAEENLRLLSQLANRKQDIRIKELLEKTELYSSRKKKVKEFSFGMKQRLGLCQCLLTEVGFLILDEATTGLDPVVRDEILDIFLEFIQDEEHSILFSTHITSDIQKVADYVILIHNGKIIFEEKKDDLIYNYGIIRCKKSEFNTVSPDDYVCCRETNLSVECLIHDKVAAKKRYQNLIIDDASIEDIMLFYIKGGVK